MVATLRAADDIVIDATQVVASIGRVREDQLSGSGVMEWIEVASSRREGNRGRVNSKYGPFSRT